MVLAGGFVPLRNGVLRLSDRRGGFAIEHFDAELCFLSGRFDFGFQIR